MEKLTDNKNIINRKFGLDLLKITALFFVVTLHLFLNTGMYDKVLTNPIIYLVVPIWCIAYTSVPIFIILFGFLNYNKKPDKIYYKRLLSLFLIFAIVAILSNIVKITLLKSTLSWTDWTINILNFSNNHYAWYAAMFFGLFLVAPYINLAFSALKDTDKLTFVIISIIMCCLTSTIIFKKIVPSWFGWGSLFPIVYYLIGAYIRVTKFKFKIYYTLPIFLLTMCFFILEMFISSYNNFLNGISWSYSSPLVLIASASLFLLLYKIDIKNQLVKKVGKAVSSASFSIYLFSSVTDLIVYYLFNSKVSSINQKLIFSPLAILTSFLTAVIGGVLI